MGPLWDYDLGFGNVNYNDCDKATGYYIKAKGIWYAQLFKDPVFVEKVKNRWNEKKEDLLKSINETLPNMYSNLNISIKLLMKQQVSQQTQLTIRSVLVLNQLQK